MPSPKVCAQNQLKECKAFLRAIDWAHVPQMWTSAMRVVEDAASFSWCTDNNQVAEFSGNHDRWAIGQPDEVLNNSQHCVSLKLNSSNQYFAMYDNKKCSRKIKLVCQVKICF